MSIHPTAIIAEGAQLASSVQIGPYCIIGEHVSLDEGVVLHSHVVIAGHTKIGENTQIFPFASIGQPPQDLKYNGEESTLEIGARNVIREYATIHPGTKGGGMVTKVGDDGMFMAGIHIAHDCRVGNKVVMVNNATIAGHVEVGDHVIIGGLSAVHQFVRIGRHAMIGGFTAVDADVIPFGSVIGERARLGGLNLNGLKRRNFDRETIHAMRSVYRELFESEKGTLAERAAKARLRYEQADIIELIDFVLADSKRSICV